MRDHLATLSYEHRDSDIEQLYHLLVRWQRLLGMERWDVRLQVEDIGEGFMQVERQTSYERAVIKVSPSLITRTTTPDQIPLELTDDRIEQILVHELLHCRLTDLISIVYDDLDGMLHRDVHDIVAAHTEREEERFVDALASRLVDMRKMIDDEDRCG